MLADLYDPIDALCNLDRASEALPLGTESQCPHVEILDVLRVPGRLLTEPGIQNVRIFDEQCALCSVNT